MSGKDASGPNISLIALIVIGVIFLIGFYYADRTSSPEAATVSERSSAKSGSSASANNSNDSSYLNKMEEKHRHAIADDSRPGFSGSYEAYRNHAEMVESARALSAKGFSGSGQDYQTRGAVSREVKDVDGVTATGQSLEDYLAGGSAPTKKASSSASATKKSTTASSSKGGAIDVKEIDGVTATGQSLEDYLAGTKSGSNSSSSSAASKKKSASSSSSKEPFSGTMDAYLNKYGS